LIFFAQAMPAAIFGFAVVFFPFISIAILFLRFTVGFLSRGYPAWITAVSLSPEARPADTENQPAPSAPDLDH